MSKIDRYYPNSLYKPFFFTHRAIQHFSNKFKDHYQDKSGSRQIQEITGRTNLNKLIRKRVDWDEMKRPIPKDYLDAIGLHHFLLDTFVSMDLLLYKDKIKQYFYYEHAWSGGRWFSKKYKFDKRLGGVNLLKHCRMLLEKHQIKHMVVMNVAYDMVINMNDVRYIYKYPSYELRGEMYYFLHEKEIF